MDENLIRMSRWYPKVKDISIPSDGLEVGEEFARRAAELFLEMMRAEDTGGSAYAVAKKLLDEFPEARGFLERKIREWGGIVVRGDGASPKDACCELAHDPPWRWAKIGAFPIPGTQGNACVCVRPEAAAYLLIRSERMHVIGLLDWIWARKPVRLMSEMRVFVRRGKPRLVTWYYKDEPPPGAESALIVARRYARELVPEAVKRVGVQDVVIDCGLARGKPVVVEVTPFPPVDNERRLVGGVDTILFEKDFADMLEKAEEEDAIFVRFPIRVQEVRTATLQPEEE